MGICSLIWWGNAIATPLSLSINQARQQADGVEVQIAGRVTVPSGLFESANLDKGFAIQDETGGLYISTDSHAELQPGEAVEVLGTLQDDGHGQRMLMLEQWQHSRRAIPPISPRPVSLSEAGRKLDGEIVTVRGTIVKPLKEDAPYGDRLWIEDDTGQIQIYLPKSTRISPKAIRFLHLGQAIQVTGLSSQYDDSDEVIPRSPSDILRVDN